MKTVDLKPQEISSDRPKPREPIFGAGALPFIGGLIGTAFTLGMLILIALLMTKFNDVVFGETKQTFSPRPATVIQNGYTYSLQPDGSYK